MHSQTNVPKVQDEVGGELLGEEEELGENASDVDSPGIQEPEVIIDEATTETENLEEGPRAEGEEKEEKTVRRGRSQSIPKKCP